MVSVGGTVRVQLDRDSVLGSASACLSLDCISAVYSHAINAHFSVHYLAFQRPMAAVVLHVSGR